MFGIGLPKYAQNDAHAEVADRIVRANGRKPDQHTVMAENVASYLAQMTDSYVDRLRHVPTHSLLNNLDHRNMHGPSRFMTKLNRDARLYPYTDDEAFDRLHELDLAFSQRAQVIADSHPFPCSFYAVGGLARGRFGNQSDVDIWCQSSPEWAMAHKDERRAPVSMLYMDTLAPPIKSIILEAFAPVREICVVDAVQPGALRNVYVEAVKHKGFAVVGNHLVRQSVRIHREVERPPASAQGLDWACDAL